MWSSDMNIRCLARILFAISIAFLFHPYQALAQTPAYDQCIYALDQTAHDAVNMSGSATINAPSCGVVVDSSSSTALSLSGSASFTAKYFDVVGGYSTSGAAKLTPSPSTHSAYQGDPLTFLVPPVSNACNYTNFKTTTGSSTLSPGTYCNGITISGAATVTFNPGTYILNGGGLSVSGASVLKGTGVTFFLTQGLGYKYGPMSISGSAVMTLSAPTSGPYYGILFYQDPQIGAGQATNTATGSSVSSLQGVLYFPTTALTFSGSEAGNNCLILVADTITLTGAAKLGNGCSGGSPLRPPVSVSVTPASATLYGGQTQQLTASVTNTSNTAVTWMISPAGTGTISSSGLYTAPATISTQQAVTVTAISQASTTTSASSAVTLMTKTTPVIAWVTPTAITYGTALSATQLDATASVPGTFVYTPAVGTVLTAGLQTLSVAFTPTNTTVYNSAIATVPLKVNAEPQTITFTNPGAQTFGTPLTLSATASSGMAVSYSVTSGSPATLSGSTLTFTGTGPVTVQATQAGNANYAAATPVSQSFTVNAESQTITFANPGSQTYGTPLTLSATASSGLAVSYSVTSGSPATLSGNTLTFTGAGPVTVQATQAGNANYASATPVSQSFTILAPPSVGAISPMSGPTATAVTITGSNFGATQGMSTVSFNGTAATPTDWSNTQIVVPVPSGAATGNVVVTVNGLASSGVGFTVLVPPSVSAISPNLGPAATVVTITGTNFGSPQGMSTVYFNGTAATPTNWSNTQIVVPVPSRAATGSVVVTVTGLASSGVSFTVLVPPSVGAISPVSGPTGTAVTITGTNFGATQGTSFVTFNGTTATPESWSSTQIVIPVPSGATTGSVVVNVSGLVSSGVSFTVLVPPSISTISPTSGLVGTLVTITGTNFGATQGTSTVSFDGTAATPTSWSNAQIVVPVPSGATTGNITVQVGGVSAQSGQFLMQVPVLQLRVDNTPATVNLSDPVNLDWVIWGADGQTPAATRSAAGLISNYTVLGSSNVTVQSSGSTQYTWSGGTPIASSSGSTPFINVDGLNSGFQLTAPADSTVKTLKLYAMACSNVQMNISISDGSSPAVSSSSVTTSCNETYSIDFRAGSTGQTLTVQLFSTDPGSGVSLEAAVLRPHLPWVKIVSPQNQQSFAFGSGIPILLNTEQYDYGIASAQISANGTQIYSAQSSPFATTWTGVQPGHYQLQASVYRYERVFRHVGSCGC